MEISDTGEGISEAVKKKLFEPFFTTKPRGKGTGLGLAQVFGLAKQHHADIKVDSTPGQGSCFSFYFPVSTVAADEQKTTVRQEPALALLKGEATVLVVDDEAPIRDFLQQALETLGYRILLADGPQSAQSLFQAHRDEIDILLTDVIMPKQNGHSLAQALQEQKPELSVVFMSGFADDILDVKLITQDNFIQKPLNINQLAQQLQQVCASLS